MDNKPQPKFRRRAQARPDEILDAALALFLEKGFGATRVEEIARKAGLSKGAVYLYFPSKEALLEGLVHRGVTPIANEALAMIANFRGDPRPLIGQILPMMTQRIFGEALSVPRLILHEALSAPDLAQMYRRAVLDRVLPAMTGLLRQAVEGGHIRQVDPDLTIRSIMGPILIHLLLSEIFDIGTLDPDELRRLVDNHLAILFAGLEPEAPV